MQRRTHLREQLGPNWQLLFTKEFRSRGPLYLSLGHSGAHINPFLAFFERHPVRPCSCSSLQFGFTETARLAKTDIDTATVL
jgi:hypothetical protein